MTDKKVNNNSTWQNLDWEKKVQICQQGIANQDALLYASVVIFIALEAMFFSVIFSNINLPPWMNKTVTALGRMFPGEPFAPYESLFGKPFGQCRIGNNLRHSKRKGFNIIGINKDTGITNNFRKR